MYQAFAFQCLAILQERAQFRDLEFRDLEMLLSRDFHTKTL